MFIREQATEWCNPYFVEAAHDSRPFKVNGVRCLQDWFAMWRCV